MTYARVSGNGISSTVSDVPARGHRDPAVDVRLAAVVGRERERLVAVVLVEQIAQVVAAVGDVDLRRAQVGRRERGCSRAVGQELGGLGHDLHQPLGAHGRRARVELRLGVDDRGDQRRIEVLLRRLLADHVRVVQRQPEIVDRLLDQRHRQHDAEHDGRDQDPGQQPVPAPRCRPLARGCGPSRVAATGRAGDRGRTHECSISSSADNFDSNSSTVPSLTTTYVARCAFSCL